MFFFLCFCFSLHPNQFNLGISAIVTSALSLPNLLLLHHQRFEQQMRNHELTLTHKLFCCFPTWFQYCNNHQMPTLQNPTSRNHYQKNFRNKHAKLLEIDLRSNTSPPQNGFFSKANPQNPNPNKTWTKAWNFSKSHSSSSSSSSPKHTKEKISLTRWRKSKCKFSKHKPLPKGKKQTPDTKKGRKAVGKFESPTPQEKSTHLELQREKILWIATTTTTTTTGQISAPIQGSNNTHQSRSLCK